MLGVRERKLRRKDDRASESFQRAPTDRLVLLHLPDRILINRPIMDLVRYEIVTASFEVVRKLGSNP